VRLKGVLEYSLGNFLCLRGFAPMGTLYRMSEPDPSYQRDLIREHKQEMVEFLNSGEFTFFPEVILCTSLINEGDDPIEVEKLFSNARRGIPTKRLKFGDWRVSFGVYKTKNPDDKRVEDIYRTATLETIKGSKKKFSRIDGNHRLSATPESQKFEKYNTPYCLIFFKNPAEQKKLSRALFHNINYKHIPLTMEQNLKLIIDDEEGLFPDDKLKEPFPFGWPYYLTRKLINNLDVELLPNLGPFFENEPKTFILRQFNYLIEKKVLGENENAIRRFKEALVQANTLLENNPALKESKNYSFLAALLYYELQKNPVTKTFIHWILENNLHLIETKNTGKEILPDYAQIFDKVLESRKRTIFVSMKFKDDKTENHYKIIERVCKEVNENHGLKPGLKVQRVDWFRDGTSYEIQDKIIEMINECGYLIGNLTFCNPNVYHEIGLIMGKAKAEGRDSANMLLFLDESVADQKDKFVGFNLRGIMQIRFTQTEEFAKEIKKNIEKFYKLV
jgi:hypothetical protein